MKTTNKLYRVGNSNCITVNIYIMQKLNLKEGDLVEVEFIKKV